MINLILQIKNNKRWKHLLLFFFILKAPTSFSQGYNHQWLLGNQWLFSVPKARMFIDSNSYTINTEFRKMVFEDTEANICDANGNFLMSSNGVWIANANNDTMMNGSGLNPGAETASYPHGLLLHTHYDSDMGFGVGVNFNY